MSSEAGRTDGPEGRGQRAGYSRWLSSDAPSAAIEIAARRVTVVGLAKAGDGPAVQGWASEPLPEGAVVPSLNALNVQDAATVTSAVRRAIEAAGIKGRRAGLVIPDLAAKVTLVPFEKVPERRQDLAGLISWQVRKAAPFRIEDAQMSFIEGARHGDAGRTFVVTLARKDVVRQYEDVCAAAGAHTGIVDLASFNVINAALAPGAAPASDWLLVNTTPESQTLAIMRGETLMFFRNRPIEGDETLPDLVHQTAMYYEDRLQGAGFERVVLAGGAAWSGEAVRRGLSERLHAPVTSLEPRQVAQFTGRGLDGLQPAAADALLAPLGLLLRERGSAGL
ncbi:MAG: pilus assembly protein PilM [Vicinamibacterales bacterium]